MVTLYRVILPVSNIDMAESFYSGLLGKAGKRVSPERHYFDCGGTILACYQPTLFKERARMTPNPEHLYFSVANLTAYYERCLTYQIEYRIKIEADIQSYPWGETAFYFQDPFTNHLCFVDEQTVFKG